MEEIIPAIMPQGLDDLNEKVGAIRGHAKVVQLDIMDGKFVQAKTWPYFHSNDRFFQALQNEEAGLPYWEDVDYEIDLMVEHPDQHIDQWLALGPKRIVLHIESLLHPEESLKKLSEIRSIVEIGLSFDDDYEVSNLDNYLELVDFVQVMGIDEIGVQGGPFEPRVLYNITYIREKFPDMPISVDGAVNPDTIQKLRDAGATRFVAGSAIYGSGVPSENIHRLKSLLQ